MTPKRQLSRKILEITGLTIPEFCHKFLNTKYKAFQYRIRVGRCNPNEVIFTSWYLGESVESLFGKPFAELMLVHGDAEVSAKALEILNKASKQEQKRLIGLLGGGFPLGVKSPEILPGVSPVTPEALDGSGVSPLLADEVGLVAPATITTPRNVKTQKKAPVISDQAPKKFNPFDSVDDFSVSR